MSEPITITLIQSDLYWEDPEANRASFEEKLWRIGQATDIVVLPEMFSTGFTMNAGSLAEPMNFKTQKWMQQQAIRLNAVLVGSIIVKEDNLFYNRLIWANPSGDIQYYDKKHLFRMAEEHDVFTSGIQRILVKHKGWKICPLICYDLRFPVWSKNNFDEHSQEFDYDILIYVANWPQKRVQAWNDLLKARAIENSTYTIGLNRIGEDGNGIPFNGQSVVISPKGNIELNMEDKESIQSITLQYSDLERYRQKFPTHLDWD